jgi:capsular polysaccharide biosynthesis protein
VTVRLDDDTWYESEESTRVGLVAELQRVRRRTLSRPLRVIALAAVLMGAVTYKIATRKPLVEAEVVLLLTEGSLSARSNGIPVEALKDYVADVLLPNDALAKLVERRHLDRLGRMDDAIAGLRDALEIRIWKNTFVYYDPEDETSEHSARIGLTVTSHDPESAYQLVNDFATIIIATAAEQRRAMTAQLAGEIAVMQRNFERQLDELARERSEKLVAMIAARRANKRSLAEALQLEVVEIDSEQKVAEARLHDIALSRDSIADRITAAGLDMQVQIVEDNRPVQSTSHAFLVVLIVAVIGVGSLIGSAMILSAFDARVYDVEDVSRLGLEVLGHVPGFPGDEVGSLRARGVVRARVPSFLRWRSHR